MSAAPVQPLLRRTLARMDEAWEPFHRRAKDLPIQKLEQTVEEGSWTRRQMLGHITVWHELTTERLSRFRGSGEPAELSEETDAINARAARASDGRSTGEIVIAIEDSYRRLRREVARLDDAALAAHDGWAAAVIAGNTFDHYADHTEDLKDS